MKVVRLPFLGGIDDKIYISKKIIQIHTIAIPT